MTNQRIQAIVDILVAAILRMEAGEALKILDFTRKSSGTGATKKKGEMHVRNGESAGVSVEHYGTFGIEGDVATIV